MSYITYNSAFDSSTSLSLFPSSGLHLLLVMGPLALAPSQCSNSLVDANTSNTNLRHLHSLYSSCRKRNRSSPRMLVLVYIPWLARSEKEVHWSREDPGQFLFYCCLEMFCLPEILFAVHISGAERVEGDNGSFKSIKVKNHIRRESNNLSIQNL
jgi:hypothetical protein